MTNKRLGKGFAAIVENTVQSNPSLVMLPVTQIKPGRYQPRQHIDEQTLEELKQSIKDRGIIQPVVVRPISHGVYELVAGERRWRAAQGLGLQEVPAIVRALSDQEALEYSLIENLQRYNLNSIEEAAGFARLMDEFSYTHEQLAQRLGKDRTTVINTLRLLKLPKEIQAAIRETKITQSHAKALLGAANPEEQLALFRQVIAEGMSVRRLESLVAGGRTEAPVIPVPKKARPTAPLLKSLETELRRVLGTKVVLSSGKRGGRIVINYFSEEDLTRLLQLLGVGSGTA